MSDTFMLNLNEALEQIARTIFQWNANKNSLELM